ncbi:hypothetical protein [Kribbella sp. NPDC023855]|uniref:hypothetical protein n=1 Tax=Kribbella sp. NPDC023855 TaxID=3154698 RepID=UPI0033FBCE90
MSRGNERTSEDRQSLDGFSARLDAMVEERLAEYRRTNVYVFDMFIDADDDSTDEPPNLWVARDHYTGELIQRLTGPELDVFYAEHNDWVEYSGLVDELQDRLKEEP